MFLGVEMEFSCDEHTYKIFPVRDGNQQWLAISRDGIQIGNPDIDANTLIDLIRELKTFLNAMAEI